MEQPIRRKPRRKKKTITAKQLLITAGCVIGAAALIIAACLIFGGGEAEETKDGPQGRTSMPELTVGEGQRSGQSWVVETSYLNVTLPYAFSDYIDVTAVNEDIAAALDFRVKTSTMEEKLYTLWFGGTAGEQVGSFDPGDGQGRVPVMVVFYDLPAGLSEDDQGTFKAAQETVNDVLASLTEAPGFRAR